MWAKNPSNSNPTSPKNKDGDEPIEHSSIDIELGRSDKVYTKGDTIEGTAVMKVFKGWSHQGITLTLAGVYKLLTPETSNNSSWPLEVNLIVSCLISLFFFFVYHCFSFQTLIFIV